MSGFGSFSQEAYQKLQEAYSAQLLAADESEAAGVQVGSEKFSVETGAAPSPWLEKTGLWQYPSGRGDHLDVEQKQQDLLAALQKEEEEEETASDLDSLSDEELDELIDKVLSEIEEEEEEEEEEEAGKTAEEIAAEIEALRAELAELTSETEEEDEEEEEEIVEETDDDTPEQQEEEEDSE